MAGDFHPPQFVSLKLAYNYGTLPPPFCGWSLCVETVDSRLGVNFPAFSFDEAVTPSVNSETSGADTSDVSGIYTPPL